jgi:hypothetical protein
MRLREKNANERDKKKFILMMRVKETEITKGNKENQREKGMRKVPIRIR